MLQQKKVSTPESALRTVYKRYKVLGGSGINFQFLLNKHLFPMKETKGEWKNQF